MVSSVWPLWTCSGLVVVLHGEPISAGHLCNTYIYTVYCSSWKGTHLLHLRQTREIGFIATFLCWSHVAGEWRSKVVWQLQSLFSGIFSITPWNNLEPNVHKYKAHVCSVSLHFSHCQYVCVLYKISLSIMPTTETRLMSLWKLELWMASLSWDVAWDLLVSHFCYFNVCKMANTSALYDNQSFLFTSPQDTTWTRRGWSRVCTATPGMTYPMCSQSTCPCNQRD